jgi:hypothetical protein
MGIVSDMKAVIFNSDVMSDIGETIYYIKDGVEIEKYGFVFRNMGSGAFGLFAGLENIKGATTARIKTLVKLPKDNDTEQAVMSGHRVKILSNLGDTVYKIRVIKEIYCQDEASYTFAVA